MDFMGSYKRLDNLCKDLLNSNNGVSSYIEEMERCGYAKNRIKGWNEDYANLKHYRYIRNKIAHDDYATESELCGLNDEQWIVNFRNRIINCTDPLALYRKEIVPKKIQNPSYTKKPIVSSRITVANELEQLTKQPIYRKKESAIIRILKAFFKKR